MVFRIIPRRKTHIQKGEVWRIFKIILRTLKNKTQYVKEWENDFAKYIGVKHAIAVSSGRAGLELILRSLKLNKLDEVIIPAYTLKDLIPVIQSLGFNVVPADIDLGTFNIDPDSIEKKITKRTKVILATHMSGSPCKIDKIIEIARKHSIFVIEDCAHSVGSDYNGFKTGSFGHAAFFSFEAIKPINTYGGSMIATNDKELANNIRCIIKNYKKSNLGVIKKMVVANLENVFLSTVFSFPFLHFLASPKLKKKVTSVYRFIQGHPSSRYMYTELQACLGIEKLKSLDKRIKIRQKKASILKSLLNKTIKPQKILKGIIPNYYLFVALLPHDCDIIRIRKLLLKKGIDASIEDEITDNCGAILGGKDCPDATKVFKSAIHLPLYEGLSKNQIQKIANTLNSCINEK